MTNSPIPEDVRVLAQRIARVAREANTAATAAGEQATLGELCRFYYDLKTAYQDLDTARKALYAVVDRLDKGVVPDRLGKEEGDMFRSPEIGRSFYILNKHSAKVLDRDALVPWLEANGLSDIVQPTVNASRLTSAIVKMVTDEGIDPPPEIVVLNTYATTGSSSYTPKGA